MLLSLPKSKREGFSCFAVLKKISGQEALLQLGRRNNALFINPNALIDPVHLNVH
jgi:hypothetical protein